MTAILPEHAERRATVTVVSPKNRAQTRAINARIPERIETAARIKNPELQNASDSVLMRVALLGLAGFSVKTALEILGNDRRGKRLTDL